MKEERENRMHPVIAALDEAKRSAKSGVAEIGVKVHIRSVQYDYNDSLSAKINEMRQQAEDFLQRVEKGEADAHDPTVSLTEDLYDDKKCGGAGEPFVMVTEGKLRTRGSLYEISYEESVETGLDGSLTTLVFSLKRPEVLSLTRTGIAKMTLSFEEGRHHIGSYHFGALQALLSSDSSLPIASYARRVDNRIAEEGALHLDYIVEVRGMDTQRTVFDLSLSALSAAPTGSTEKAKNA